MKFPCMWTFTIFFFVLTCTVSSLNFVHFTVEIQVILSCETSVLLMNIKVFLWS